MADTQNFDESSLDDLLWTLEQILSKQSIEGLIIIAVLMGGKWTGETKVYSWRYKTGECNRWK